MDIHSKIDILEYTQDVKNASPKSNLLLDCIKAFVVGGLICMLGQAINDLGLNLLGLSEELAGVFRTIVLIFLGSFFTGLGVYDLLGKFAGAGSIVPITGFANSIVAPAMEFKREGIVLGVGAKLFTLAGPVLVFGISSSVLYGLILMAIQELF